MAERVVAIHQPNFLPWLGYFAKIASSDVFLIMDNAQFPKTGGSWSNRVKMRVGGQPSWLTVPIVRAYHGVRSVREMEIDEHSPWRTKLLRTIRMSYARSPFFAEVFPLIEDVFAYASASLSDFNLNGIKKIMDAMDMDTNKLMLGSELDVSGAGTALLINMVKAVNGTTYLCGGGASGYQDDEEIAAAGIRLRYQSFSHPEYSQGVEVDFLPGLSIVDALMWCGISGTSSLVRGTR
ncbi:MAG TPA: WbqC family protein [Gemmatimonadaceae bacterium]|nr:WbqC family protein [Gemmatimonadaceae bacterium]